MKHLHKLPAVHRVLEHAQITPFLQTLPRRLVTDTVRAILTAIREEVRAGHALPNDTALHARIGQALLHKENLLYHKVINGTGVLLHTNLGRSPLPQSTFARLSEMATGYLNLEYNRTTGERGSRYGLLPELLQLLCGSEDALVVNNNAAAVLLVLSALACNKEVVVSRGELVEIGGGFRIPDVLRQSQCVLREVGTTNRTRITDYEQAIQENTAAVLKVHPSNYRIQGFAKTPDRKALGELCRSRGVLFLEDLGSGALVEMNEFGLTGEPTVGAVTPHVDLVTFSGDKLLGGPQCGIIAGKSQLLAHIRQHPLLRAVRCDKMTLLVLEDILLQYSRFEHHRLPLFQMIQASQESIRHRATRWCQELGPGLQGAVQSNASTVGGGSLPGESIPTWVLALDSPWGATKILTTLREHRPAIIGRICDDRVLLDPRTVLPADDEHVIAALRRGCPCM